MGWTTYLADASFAHLDGPYSTEFNAISYSGTDGLCEPGAGPDIGSTQEDAKTQAYESGSSTGTNVWQQADAFAVETASYRNFSHISLVSEGLNSWAASSTYENESAFEQTYCPYTTISNDQFTTIYPEPQGEAGETKTTLTGLWAWSSSDSSVGFTGDDGLSGRFSTLTLASTRTVSCVSNYFEIISSVATFFSTLTKTETTTVSLAGTTGTSSTTEFLSFTFSATYQEVTYTDELSRQCESTETYEAGFVLYDATRTKGKTESIGYAMIGEGKRQEAVTSDFLAFYTIGAALTQTTSISVTDTHAIIDSSQNKSTLLVKTYETAPALTGNHRTSSIIETTYTHYYLASGIGPEPQTTFYNTTLTVTSNIPAGTWTSLETITMWKTTTTSTTTNATYGTRIDGGESFGITDEILGINTDFLTEESAYLMVPYTTTNMTTATSSTNIIYPDTIHSLTLTVTCPTTTAHSAVQNVLSFVFDYSTIETTGDFLRETTFIFRTTRSFRTQAAWPTACEIFFPQKALQQKFFIQRAIFGNFASAAADFDTGYPAIFPESAKSAVVFFAASANKVRNDSFLWAVSPPRYYLFTNTSYTTLSFNFGSSLQSASVIQRASLDSISLTARNASTSTSGEFVVFYGGAEKTMTTFTHDIYHEFDSGIHYNAVPIVATRILNTVGNGDGASYSFNGDIYFARSSSGPISAPEQVDSVSFVAGALSAPISIDRGNEDGFWSGAIAYKRTSTPGLPVFISNKSLDCGGFC